MGHLKKRFQFYRTMATLEAAGVHVLRALQQNHPAPFRQVADRMSRQISGGGLTLSDAMRQHRLFGPFECNIVRVGERTGRLDTVFSSLAEWFEFSFKQRGHVISGLVYPVILYHFAVLIFSLLPIVTEKACAAGALRNLALGWGAPWAVVFLFLVVLPKLSPSGGLPAPLGAMLLAVPVLGPLLYRLDNTRFFRAFGLAQAAGVGTAEATRLAAGTCSNTSMRKRYLRIAEAVGTEGCTFTEAFKRLGSYRDRRSMAMPMLESGEQSGALDDMAHRVADVYGEQSTQSLKRITTIVPVAIYLCIAIVIAMKIIGFYGNMIGQINEVMEF